MQQPLQSAYKAGYTHICSCWKSILCFRNVRQVLLAISNEEGAGATWLKQFGDPLHLTHGRQDSIQSAAGEEVLEVGDDTLQESLWL